MGLITSSYRMMYLTAYQFTLENKIQWISTAKMELMTSSDEILGLGNDLDPENPAVKSAFWKNYKKPELPFFLHPFSVEAFCRSVPEYENRFPEFFLSVQNNSDRHQ